MLLTTTQKLQVVLAAVPTTQLPVVTAWADMAADASTLAPNSATTATNSTTAVDVVAAPAAGLRQLKYLSVHNVNAASVTVTIRVDDATTPRIVATVALLAGYRLEYLQETGLRVLTETGGVLGLGTPGTNGVGVPVGGTVGQVLSKIDATNYNTAWTTPAPGGGGGGTPWSTDSLNTTMAQNNAYIAVGALNMTLPASTVAGGVYIVHAQSATVTVVSNGNVITGVGAGNDLTLAIGETAQLVVRTAGNLEIV